MFDSENVITKTELCKTALATVIQSLQHNPIPQTKYKRLLTSLMSVQLIPSPSIPRGHSPHSNPFTVAGSLKQGTPGKQGLKRQKS